MDRVKDWLWAFVLLLLISGVLFYAGSRIYGAAQGRRTDVKARAAADVKVAALTFDDGPKAGTTDVLLDGLKERNVKATFFLIGMQVKGNETIVEQMYREGHQIGNHTFEHVNLKEYSEDGQKCQLLLCNEAVSQVIGREPHFIRPPFGEISDSLKSWVRTPIIMWSVDTKDWTGKSASDIADYIVKNIQPGDIVLLHDIYKESVKGALMAVDTLKKQGYEFVTIEELFECYDIPLENGKVYKKTY